MGTLEKSAPDRTSNSLLPRKSTEAISTTSTREDINIVRTSCCFFINSYFFYNIKIVHQNASTLYSKYFKIHNHYHNNIICIVSLKKGGEKKEGRGTVAA